MSVREDSGVVLMELERTNTQFVLDEGYERSTWSISGGEDDFVGYLEEVENGYEAGILEEDDTNHYDSDPRFFSGETLEVEGETPEQVFSELMDETYEESMPQAEKRAPKTV